MKVAKLLLLVVIVAGGGVLAGCAGGVMVPELVATEVPVPCVKPEAMPVRPSLRSEADLMSLPRGTRTLATWSERAKLEAYALQLEAIAQGCSRLPEADVPP